ncbi:hypothetical protein HDU76_009198 [Blyttiomyces sp. JEL0837]|nr:hypothetical protein HDU76_009198 [Blyttiomyces sp. JEL0837]
MRHKLCVYIVKNPPTPSAKGTKAQKEAARIATKGTQSLPTPESASNDSNGEDEDELSIRINKEAAQLGEVNVDDDDWSQDTSEAAVAARLKELAMGAPKNLVAVGDDEEEDENDPIDEFAAFVEKNLTSDDAIYEKATELGIATHNALAVLAQLLFNGKILTENQITKRSAIFKKFLASAENPEKAQKGLLGGIERVVSEKKNKADLIPKVPLVLKALYDEELVDEEKSVAKEIREKAAPFLNWLKEAEEDDDEEEEDDE